MDPARLLTPYLDSLLVQRGFSRRSQSAKYSRKLGAARQTIEVVADRRHRGDALAVIQPWIEVAMPEIDGVLLMMADGLPTPPTGTLRQPASFTSFDDEAGHWDLPSEAQAPRIAALVGQFLLKWTVPFLDEYFRPADVIRSVEQRDERVVRDRNQILRGVAAALAVLGPTEALRVLEEQLNAPELRDAYAPVFQYLRRKQLN